MACLVLFFLVVCQSRSLLRVVIQFGVKPEILRQYGILEINASLNRNIQSATRKRFEDDLFTVCAYESRLQTRSVRLKISAPFSSKLDGLHKVSVCLPFRFNRRRAAVPQAIAMLRTRASAAKPHPGIPDNAGRGQPAARGPCWC